jgi:hypothetical protein
MQMLKNYQILIVGIAISLAVYFGLQSQKSDTEVCIDEMLATLPADAADFTRAEYIMMCRKGG